MQSKGQNELFKETLVDKQINLPPNFGSFDLRIAEVNSDHLSTALILQE